MATKPPSRLINENSMNGMSVSGDFSPAVLEVLERLQPLSMEVMKNPSVPNLNALIAEVKKSPSLAIQEMNMYLMYPLVYHIKQEDLKGKHELQRKIIEAMGYILSFITITDITHYVKYFRCMLLVVLDKDRPGSMAQIPEELMEEVLEVIVHMTLKLTDNTRMKLYNTQYAALLGNGIYCASQIAKREKLRSLKLTAITCIAVLSGTHDSFYNERQQLKNATLAMMIGDELSKILPGILGALTEVAMSKENQGHMVTVKAINIIHRVICLVMNDNNSSAQADVTNADFSRIAIAKKTNATLTRYFSRRETEADSRMPSRQFKNLTTEFLEMAGLKLKVITDNLMTMLTHEHVKVRLELTHYCCRIFLECSRTMRTSMPAILDALIGLSDDEDEEISTMCLKTLQEYFEERDLHQDTRETTLNTLADNFYNIVSTLPMFMNNIDTRRKEYNLELIRAYIALLCTRQETRKLTEVLSNPHTLATLCNSLVIAAKMDSSKISLLLEPSLGEIEGYTPVNNAPRCSPWVKLANIESKLCEEKLKSICDFLGCTECVEVIVDKFLEMLDEGTDKAEVVYLLTEIAKAQSNVNVERILDTYIEPDLWYVPLEVASSEVPVPAGESLDVTVYNPRAWDKDSVPGLYEGAVETRYTDISLQKPRAPLQIRDVTKCRTLREAKDNMVLACLLTEGVGALAKKLKHQFQPYMLKTLCLLLERIGSRYEMLRMAGMGALCDVTIAFGHSDVTQLIRNNADYFTYQVTKRLKKEWNCVSALHILRVVLQHSDATIMDCMQGVITDVLLQSCDQYHKSDITSYLQVFLTFMNRIRKWFLKDPDKTGDSGEIDDKRNVLADTMDYIKNKEESERLLDASEFEAEMGKTTEEMFKEDLNKKQEEEEIDYSDDKEKAKLPQHIVIVTKILSRCVHLLPSNRREEQNLAIEVLEQGLPILEEYQDELLPLCHQIWGPLVGRFSDKTHPAVLLRAFRLLVVMSRLAKDFIRDRTVKEVLPILCDTLTRLSKMSLLKDAGSVYRVSHEFHLQLALVGCWGQLAVDLGLQDRQLELMMSVASPYLSNKQPKPLQSAAIDFYKGIIQYDPGAACYHLRALCNNQIVHDPPTLPCKKLTLEPVVGTPDTPSDHTYKKNIEALLTIISFCYEHDCE